MTQPTQTVMGGNGNTSNIPSPRGRLWMFTWNNYTDDDKKFIENWINNNCIKALINPEVGKEGTPHLQGYMEFKNARTFSAIKKIFPNIHLELARNKSACEAYCQKEDTKQGETFRKGYRRPVKDPLEGKELYPWQKYVLEILESEADDRTIYWFWEEIGNFGKSALVKHINLKFRDTSITVQGKGTDIKYGVKAFLDDENNELDVLILDFSRTIEGYISYDTIEHIKNGNFYNTKYESKQCLFNYPHIFCFANFKPEEKAMSLDRWKIINIREFENNIIQKEIEQLL